MEPLNKANEVICPVETQWHYPIMIKYGFSSTTPPQKGLVRGYLYTDNKGNEFNVNTGVNADYWQHKTGGHGYWGSLEKYLKTL